MPASYRNQARGSAFAQSVGDSTLKPGQRRKPGTSPVGTQLASPSDTTTDKYYRQGGTQGAQALPKMPATPQRPQPVKAAVEPGRKKKIGIAVPLKVTHDFNAVIKQVVIELRDGHAPVCIDAYTDDLAKRAATAMDLCAAREEITHDQRRDVIVRRADASRVTPAAPVPATDPTTLPDPGFVKAGVEVVQSDPIVIPATSPIDPKVLLGSAPQGVETPFTGDPAKFLEDEDEDVVPEAAAVEVVTDPDDDDDDPGDADADDDDEFIQATRATPKPAKTPAQPVVKTEPAPAPALPDPGALPRQPKPRKPRKPDTE